MQLLKHRQLLIQNIYATTETSATSDPGDPKVSATTFHQVCVDTRGSTSPVHTLDETTNPHRQGTGGACPRPGKQIARRGMQYCPYRVGAGLVPALASHRVRAG